MRIGFGYDAHRLEAGRKLVLGGVIIPFDRGLLAHSDGDVLIHSLCDALLGAAGLGDIGQHFPDTQAKYAGIDSRILLRHVMDLVGKKGLSLANADITIVAQAPKLVSHMPAMKKLLASDMGVVEELLNIKATTTEGMGYAGRGEGIAAYSVVLLDH